MASAKRYKLRGSAIVALAVLVFSVVAVGVNAYEPCQRIVQKYAEKFVPHHYSKTTLAKWAVWGKAHPNYHPPKRPPLQPKETLDKVNFDCSIAPEPVLVAGLLDPSSVDGPVFPKPFVTIDTAPLPASKTISLVDAPLQVPLSDTTATPEPGSWIFGFSGAAFVALCFWFRSRKGLETSATPIAAL